LPSVNKRKYLSPKGKSTDLSLFSQPKENFREPMEWEEIRGGRGTKTFLANRKMPGRNVDAFTKHFIFPLRVSQVGCKI
jgi:hypothetical protein